MELFKISIFIKFFKLEHFGESLINSLSIEKSREAQIQVTEIKETRLKQAKIELKVDKPVCLPLSEERPSSESSIKSINEPPPEITVVKSDKKVNSPLKF